MSERVAARCSLCGGVGRRHADKRPVVIKHDSGCPEQWPDPNEDPWIEMELDGAVRLDSDEEK